VAAGREEWRKWIESVCVGYGRELVMGFHGYVCWGLLSVVSFKTNKPAGTWLYPNQKIHFIRMQSPVFFLKY